MPTFSDFFNKIFRNLSILLKLVLIYFHILFTRTLGKRVSVWFAESRFLISLPNDVHKLASAVENTHRRLRITRIPNVALESATRARTNLFFSESRTAICRLREIFSENVGSRPPSLLSIVTTTATATRRFRRRRQKENLI